MFSKEIEWLDSFFLFESYLCLRQRAGYALVSWTVSAGEPLDGVLFWLSETFHGAVG